MKLPELSHPQSVLRFVGELFGVCADRKPPTIAMKLGSFLAGFGYVMVLGGLILLYLAASFPDLSEWARYRIASTVGVVVLVSLPRIIPLMPRFLRLGMVGAWALVAVGADDMRRVSTSANGQTMNGAELACVAIEDRAPPAAIHVDSFAYAIEGDLALMNPDGYLDLLYTGVMTYSANHSSKPPSVAAAFDAIGLQGPAYHRFGRDLGRFRIREEDGEAYLDIWFCGFDLECRTCDDRTGFYPWPKTAEEAVAATPQVIRDTIDRVAKNSSPQR